jgi:hypothetical protein
MVCFLVKTEDARNALEEIEKNALGYDDPEKMAKAVQEAVSLIEVIKLENEDNESAESAEV